MKNVDIKRMAKEMNLKIEDIEEVINQKSPKTLDELIVELRIKYYEADTEEKKKKIAEDWDNLAIERTKELERPYDAMTSYFNSRPSSTARKITARKWVELCKNFLETRQAVLYLEKSEERDIAFEKLLSLSNDLDSLKEILTLTTYRKKWYQSTINKIASFFQT